MPRAPPISVSDIKGRQANSIPVRAIVARKAEAFPKNVMDTIMALPYFAMLYILHNQTFNERSYNWPSMIQQMHVRAGTAEMFESLENASLFGLQLQDAPRELSQRPRSQIQKD